MSTISKKLQDKIVSTGGINTDESFKELCDLAYEEGHKYVIRARLYEGGEFVAYLHIKGVAVEKDKDPKDYQHFHISFLEVGAKEEFGAGMIWGVLDELPKGIIIFEKSEPQKVDNFGMLTLWHKKNYLGLLATDGGFASDLIDAGVGTLHYEKKE
ncbi:hypothetical protein NRK67_03180 [Fusobacteria bacterium ZRK30]|nr:hypothetical protein NRK67_03180 [Fusobacteria bacterium ZRK30]